MNNLLSWTFSLRKNSYPTDVSFAIYAAKLNNQHLLCTKQLRKILLFIF